MISLLLSVSVVGALAQPMATEVFNLRSLCAALAGKMLEEQAIGAALTQSQISRYDPRTNRCYVEITVQSSKDSRYQHRYLYDGQTKELLASSRSEKGIRGGMIFDRQHIPTRADGWDDANEYIDQMMAEDKK